LLTKPNAVLKQVTSQFQLQLGKARIPMVLLGTSPFIGAAQFGSRAYTYYARFYEKPRNIAKIMLKAVDLGVTGVQVLPYRPVFEALKIAERELKTELTVVGTIGPSDPLGDLKRFEEFNTVAMLLHGALTDQRKTRQISGLLNKIYAVNRLAGLVTHKPFSTLKWLLAVKLDFDIVMLPFNKIGRFMDAEPRKVAELAKKLGKLIIGKKVLAAGQIDPKEALKFVVGMSCLDAVALGVASETEAEETFRAAISAFSGRNTRLD